MADSDPVVEAEVVGEELVPAGQIPAVVAHEAIMARGELTVDEVVAQKDKITQIMQRVMTDGTHYGRIPGIDKPTLLKPGAEAINVALRLAPDYESEKVIDGRHLTVFSKCVLRHIPTGLIVASGEGMCSTQESKYATRKRKRVCPDCGAEAIIVGKKEYGGGFVCWKKEGGCGTKFGEADARITTQEEGVIENPDLPDLWNTVLKMADKRALVAAVLNGTAASDVFTQDAEDRAVGGGGGGAAENPVTRSDLRAYPVPHTWVEIEKGVRECDNPDEAWPMFQAFMRAASYHLFGEVDQTKMDADQRMTLVQKAAGAVCWLHDNDAGRDGPFSFFIEGPQRQAWAAMLDGVLLEIPDYKPPEPPVPDAVQDEVERIAAEVFADDAAASSEPASTE